MTTTHSMQKFNHGCISDFLLPGMGKEQILRYCEIPVLIKDVIQDGIKSYVQKGYIEDMFPLHDIVSYKYILFIYMDRLSNVMQCINPYT